MDLNQHNWVTWIFFPITLLSFQIYVSRPVVFLLSGLSTGTHQQPHIGYSIACQIQIISKIIVLFTILLYNTYSLKSQGFRFIFELFLVICVLAESALFIFGIVSFSTCNDPNILNNPCNSELYTCYYPGQNVTGYCTTAPALSNPRVLGLKPNPIFIEFYTWICFFLITDIFYIIIHAMKSEEVPKTIEIASKNTSNYPNIRSTLNKLMKSTKKE